MKTMLLCLAGALGSILLTGCATTGNKPSSLASDDMRAQLEVLRSDFNSSKIRTLNEVMKLTADEAEKFWPIYRAYENELASVGDRRLALIQEFATHHRAATLDNQNSKVMADQWLTNSEDRLELWKKYHRQISETVSAMRAAQFLQVENQMAIFVDLCIASEMPLIGSSQSLK